MVAGQFKEEEGGVSMLRMLPQENRISHTEKFFPENYLGYSFLIQAVEAEYKSGEERYKMFVITQATKEDIHKVLNSYLKFTGTDIDIAIEEGKVINIEDIFHGKVFLLTWNNCLYGIFDTENKDLAFKILNKLQNQ
jgi:hypothetical protein